MNHAERETLSFDRPWTLPDREGIYHIALRENDDDARRTPIACGGGIILPRSQGLDPVTCPECVEARLDHRRRLTAIRLGAKP